ncbi:aminotransferase class V-fold PLP-dependent enzyme [Microlunatus sp. Y2014]|uniref:aminotransferase class V-fold PLP-dependent enzyme n=1 Tax=Microlunatus sp. Y2014 TaxID=3418488 RepID=UPI003DA70268
MITYSDLGIRPVVNAAGRYTAMGGSVMPPEVVTAMVEAAKVHVPIPALHEAVGARLAELTRNEAAYVTTGAGAGIVLSVLAAAAGDDPEAIIRQAEGRGPTIEVIVQRAHAIPYLPAIRLAGATVVEAGTRLGATTSADLAAATSDRTVAIFHVAGDHLSTGALPLTDVVAYGKDRGIPVIVDAAAQLPPVSNLWHFTAEQGADVALFSGGKDLLGPQASGLVVGRADLVDAMRMHGSPNQRLARALKTGKEEIMGLLAAVERYVTLDHGARARRWDDILRTWLDALGDLPGARVFRTEMNEAGQALPRLIMEWESGPTPADMVAHAAAQDPAVAIVRAGLQGIGMTPEIVTDDEVPLVAAAVRAAWAELAG